MVDISSLGNRRPSWLSGSVMIHETNFFPPRIWRPANITGPSTSTGIGGYEFDAICVFTGERIQGYMVGVDPRPVNWREVSEMDVVAISGMTEEEYRKHYWKLLK